MSLEERYQGEIEAACEFVAIAALAAAEAGAPPAWALGLGLKLADAREMDMSAAAAHWRRLRAAPDPGLLPAMSDAPVPARALLALAIEAEENGDDLRERLRIYLANSFERREFSLRRRIETVPVYMIIVLVLFFMPAILLMLIGPSFLALLRALYAA